MEATKQNPLPVPPQLYRGADTCDWSLEWVDTDPELVALLKACHAADPDELTPHLALADWLGEHGDPREAWVRVGCDLWAACRELEPGHEAWDYNQAAKALGPVCASATGWRLVGLWGCLVGWHGPAGWGDQPMGRTWVDARVREVNRFVWWWALGFVAGSQADAAGNQADVAGRQAVAAERQAVVTRNQAYAARNQTVAAGNQAVAAENQAYAAENQAYAARNQAIAVGRQAVAAWRQAFAAENQAVAAWRQAYTAESQAVAAWRQAYTAESQAYAAGNQAIAVGRQARNRMWRWARRAWELCATKLTALESAAV